MDMKLEVVVLPLTDVDRAKHFYLHWDGVWTPMSRQATTSVSSNSQRPAHRARSSSVPESPQQERPPSQECISQSPTSTPREPN